MSNVKYYYDSETLTYRQIIRKKRTAIKHTMVFLMAASIFGFLIVLVAGQYFESPKEKALNRELQNLELHFNLLNKKMEEVETVLTNIEDRDNAIYRLYFEANPIPEAQRKQGLGGVNRYKKYDGFNNSELIIDANKRIDVLQKRITVQSKSLDEITELAKDKESFLAKIPAIQPIRNNNLNRVASGFGYRVDPLYKDYRLHPHRLCANPKPSQLLALVKPAF